MRHPEILDYEGVFPSKRSRPADAEPIGKPVFKELDLDRPATQQAADPAEQTEARPRFIDVEAGLWTGKKGHSLSFACLFAFSIVLFFRPYETIPALSSFKTMAFYTGIVTLVVYFVSQLSLEGNLTARPREVNMVLLLGLAGLLSIPLAIDRPEAWETFTDLCIKTILIFLVLANVIRTELRFKLLIWLVMIVSVYLSIDR